MYLGKMVELAETDELFDNPMHPYTRALLEAVPIPDPVVEQARAHQVIKGEISEPDQSAFGLRIPSALRHRGGGMPERIPGFPRGQAGPLGCLHGGVATRRRPGVRQGARAEKGGVTAPATQPGL